MGLKDVRDSGRDERLRVNGVALLKGEVGCVVCLDGGVVAEVYTQ